LNTLNLNNQKYKVSFNPSITYYVNGDNPSQYFSPQNQQLIMTLVSTGTADFMTADTDTMFRILDHNEADIMLTLDNHVYHRDYIIAHEEPVSMHFVTGVTSPFATEKALTLRDIVNYPFILTEGRVGYRRSLEEAFAKRSLEVLPMLEVGRTDVITMILEQGVGVSFLPDFVTKKKVEEGLLTYLEVSDLETDIWKQLIYHKDKWITKSMQVLIEYIKRNEFGR
jgi:DNA-binding transcriptional LysR family regulator